MNIKLNVSEALYPELMQKLTAAGFTVTDDADLILHERSKSITYLSARRDNAAYRVPVSDVIFIESFGKTVVLHTMEEDYTITERLKELEVILSSEDFLRISNSVIIAKTAIKSIRPTLSRKFILTLKNGAAVDVTRSYYERFREALHI